MYFKQFYLGCLAHASYLIADETTKVAAVVDPQRDIHQYMDECQANGFEIKYVLLTHFHADFLAGHLELRQRLGAKIMLGAAAAAEYDFAPCKEGESIEFGDVKLGFLETPGHTPEGLCILVYDKQKSAEHPYAVLTGDTLFVGDVGRPDLLASEGHSAEELAGMLYDSLHNKLMSLPDDTLIYPAHGAGSMCGKNLGKEKFSSIGEQKKLNYALKIKDRDEFVRTLIADQCDAPGYFIMNADLNKKERQILHDALPKALTPIAIDDVIRMHKEGAQILDTRGPSEYAQGYLKGSVNIGLSGNYASWAGTVLDHKAPIVVVANQGKEEEAILRLGRIGYDNVVGFVEGGPPAFLFRPELVAHFERLSAFDLNDELKSEKPPYVIDVRTEAEFADKRIEGTVNIPLNKLSKRLNEVPRDRRLVIHCLGGYRSMIAASILSAHGFDNLTDLVGGINAWIEDSLPVVRQATQAACG